MKTEIKVLCEQCEFCKRLMIIDSSRCTYSIFDYSKMGYNKYDCCSNINKNGLCKNYKERGRD